MAGIAQLVRAPDCGSGGRGFKSRYSPQALCTHLDAALKDSRKLLRFAFHRDIYART